MELPARFRLVARIASVVALLLAGLLIYFGSRSAAEVDQLVREGVLVQGVERDRRTSEEHSETVVVGYVVDGREYRVQTSFTPRTSREPLLEDARADTSRLGPEAPLQVVYLRGDPAVARLRTDLQSGMTPFLIAAALFGLVGIIFGLLAILSVNEDPSWWKNAEGGGPSGRGGP